MPREFMKSCQIRNQPRHRDCCGADWQYGRFVPQMRNAPKRSRWAGTARLPSVRANLLVRNGVPIYFGFNIRAVLECE